MFSACYTSAAKPVWLSRQAVYLSSIRSAAFAPASRPYAAGQPYAAPQKKGKRETQLLALGSVQ